MPRSRAASAPAHDADVGHAQVEHVDVGLREDPADGAAHGDPPRPRLGRGHRRVPEGHRLVLVTRALDERRTRVVTGSAPGDRDHARDLTRVGEQRVPEVYEERGDPSRVALARPHQAPVDVGVQEELAHGEPLAGGTGARWRGPVVEIGPGQPGDAGERSPGGRDRVEEVGQLLVPGVPAVPQSGYRGGADGR